MGTSRPLQSTALPTELYPVGESNTMIRSQELRRKKEHLVVTGIEPMTFGLLDQRSTN